MTATVVGSVSGFEFRLDRGHFRQLHLFHQPIHSSLTDFYAIICFKNLTHFLSSVTAFYFRINLKNTGFYALIFNHSFWFFGIKMFVIAAVVYIQNTAQSCDSVFVTQNMYSINSLPECGVIMASAFFNMIFSSSNVRPHLPIFRILWIVLFVFFRFGAMPRYSF